MVSTTRTFNASRRLTTLPNEITALTMQHLPPPDLASLCRTSHSLRNIAMPMLYRAISLTTGSQFELFLRSIQCFSDDAILYAAHQFSLKKVREPDAEPSSAFYNAGTFNALLCRLTLLKVLKLVTVVIDFTELFQHGQFEQLTRLECMVTPRSAAPLTSFLKRHKTLTFLSLDAPRGLELSGPIILPNLTHFYGSSALLPAFDFRDVSLTMLGIMMKFDSFNEPEPFDLNGISNAINLQVFDAILPDEGEMLSRIATHLPHVERLAFSQSSRFAPRISLADALDIETNLLKFDALRILNLGGMGGDHSDDRDTVVRWGAACTSLHWITLNRQKWYRQKKGWVTSIR
ncbi:hypothetical protein R3P38DRAFT_3004559 [Favolaschia claudopus]|uniref:F-box domain-containing protein n=1 Tax=Favolaschia claudopus TaxID=2862362 RepID=A0AAW0AMA8_9AGAR